MDLIFKEKWTEKDFDQMGWHDCRIYSIQFNPEKFEFILDIDYILEWVSDKEQFKFLVTPATLIFINVWDIHFDFDFSHPLTINSIDFANPVEPRNIDFINYKQEWDWRIDLFSGDISFKSVGFIQTNRKKPALLTSQTLGEKERSDLQNYYKSIVNTGNTDDTIGFVI